MQHPFAVCVAHLGRGDLTTYKAYGYSTDAYSDALGMIYIINDCGVREMYPRRWFSTENCQDVSPRRMGQRGVGCL
jgi:hypothetical protein